MTNNYNLANKKILITGVSFIGVHLVERLIQEKVGSITIVNRTNKHKNNISPHLDDVAFYAFDLRNLHKTKKIVNGHDIVIHLAADHGGRGYVNLKQGNTASNFLLDGSVFKACLDNSVEKVFFASSGCVYPNHKQTDIQKKQYLKESDVTPPYDADNMYGWAKLMGELTLKQYHKDFGLKSAIGRFFTVYGPYASESHAVMATIAKAFVKQDPFLVWGDGSQIRNWTYIEDIVEGILKCIEHIDDATPINLGTTERISVKSMVSSVLKYMNYRPQSILYQKNMPIGPLNRVANIAHAKKSLNWAPKYSFVKGLKKTADWYIQNNDVEKVRAHLDDLLI